MKKLKNKKSLIQIMVPINNKIQSLWVNMQEIIAKEKTKEKKRFSKYIGKEKKTTISDLRQTANDDLFTEQEYEEMLRRSKNKPL